MWKRLIWFLAAIPLTTLAQVTADVPPFTADEIAIYRDFLLHYPGPLSQIIGMQDTTVAFDASWAFGPEPNPPKVQIPTYSRRQLPPEILALTDEKAVTARMAAAGLTDVVRCDILVAICASCSTTRRPFSALLGRVGWCEIKHLFLRRNIQMQFRHHISPQSQRMHSKAAVVRCRALVTAEIATSGRWVDQ
jgi:hypothetical protein